MLLGYKRIWDVIIPREPLQFQMRSSNKININALAELVVVEAQPRAGEEVPAAAAVEARPMLVAGARSRGAALSRGVPKPGAALSRVDHRTVAVLSHEDHRTEAALSREVRRTEAAPSLATAPDPVSASVLTRGLVLYQGGDAV